MENNGSDEIEVYGRPQTEKDRAEASLCFARLLSDYRPNAGMENYPQCSTGMQIILLMSMLKS